MKILSGIKCIKKLLVPLLLTFLLNASAQGVYKSSEGEVSFFSKAPLENIEAHNKSLTSLINTSTREVVFVVPIRNFKFAKTLMQEHFNEKYLESDKYHDATFKGKINESIDFTKDGEYKVTASGTMTIHGVEKQVTDSGTLKIKSGTLLLNSAFMIALKDYNIKIPTLVIKNIADVIPVKLNASYLPYKKEGVQ